MSCQYEHTFNIKFQCLGLDLAILGQIFELSNCANRCLNQVSMIVLSSYLAQNKTTLNCN
jgi:hypothetical protein